MSDTGGDGRVQGKQHEVPARIDSWVREQLDLAHDTYLWGEEAALEASVDGFTVDQLATALHQVKAWAAAARLLSSQLKGELAGRLGDGEAYRHGDTIYRRGLKVTRRLIDPARFVDWLGDDLVRVVRIDPSAVRSTAVKAVCEKRGVDVSMVWDTFFDFEEGADELKQMPYTKAPKWTQRLGDGERGTR